MLVLEEAAYCDEGFFYEVIFCFSLLMWIKVFRIDAGGGKGSGKCSGQ